MATATVTTDVFQGIGVSVDNAVNTFIVDVATNVIDNIQPLAFAGVSAYLLIIGIQVLLGKAGFESFVRTAMRFGTVMALLASYSVYDKMVVKGYYNVEYALVSSITGFEPVDEDSNVVDGVSGGVYAAMDILLGKGFTIVNTIFRGMSDLSWRAIGKKFWLIIAALMVLTAIGAMTVMGAILIITAKVAVVALLAVGPVFIFLFMWPITTQFTVAWLSQIWNYTFQLFFVILFMSFATALGDGFMERFIIENPEASTATNVFLGSVQLLFLGIVILFLLKSSNAMAQSIGGGVSLGSVDWKDLGNAARDAGSAVNKLNKFNPIRYGDKQVQRFDENGEAQTTSRREHKRAGRSLAAKGAGLNYARSLGNRRIPKNEVAPSSDKRSKRHGG